MKNGADFAVFVNTAQEFDGSDSGACAALAGPLEAPCCRRCSTMVLVLLPLPPLCAQWGFARPGRVAATSAAGRGWPTLAAHNNSIPSTLPNQAGARPDEAVSWGKIRADAQPVKVCGDASILFPLIISQTFARNWEPKPPLAGAAEQQQQQQQQQQQTQQANGSAAKRQVHWPAPIRMHCHSCIPPFPFPPPFLLPAARALLSRSLLLHRVTSFDFDSC